MSAFSGCWTSMPCLDLQPFDWHTKFRIQRHKHRRAPLPGASSCRSKSSECLVHNRASYPLTAVRAPSWLPSKSGQGFLQPRQLPPLFRGQRISCRGKARGEQDDLEGEEQDEEEDNSAAQSAVWLIYGGYMLWLLVLPFAPGDPAWAIKPETIEELVACSYNFFYVIPALSALLPDFIQSPVVHPTSEALFNFVNAWSIMFGPLIVADRRSRHISPPVILLWLGQIFLTNVFLIPYAALRLGAPRGTSQLVGSPSAVETEKSNEDGAVWTIWRSRVAGQSKAIGLLCGAIGLASIAWFGLGRAEGGAFGDWSERWQFFQASVNSNRLSYAFVWDLALYSIFQAWLIGEIARERGESLSGKGQVAVFRFVPFFGLAACLVSWRFDPEDSERSE